MALFANLRARLGDLAMSWGMRQGARPSQNQLFRKYFETLESKIAMYYDAASTSRVRHDWSTSTGTPYDNISADLKKLIARSRESADNNGLSDSIDAAFTSNVISTGIKPEAVVADENGEPMEDVNKALNAGWERYNDQWDRSGAQPYYEVQSLALKTIINSGGILRNSVQAKKGNWLPIANQLIEPDRLDFSRDTWPKSMADDAAARKQTQFGIDLDEYGEPIGFWVQGIQNRVSAENMDMRFRKRRPEQFIGIPWKAPILTSLWDLSSLMEDQFVSSRIRAMISLWVSKRDAPGILKKADSNNQIGWEPGRIMYSDVKPELIDSGNDISANFDPLTRLIQRTVAIGSGLSYQILTKDLQGMNFAASRANILEDRRMFQLLQKWFIKSFCQRDWNNYVKWSFMAGRMAPLTYADYLADPWKWTQCFWQPPGWDWVDPLNDAKAAIELYKMNMLSLKDHYGSKGKNWEREVAQIALERDRLKEIGLEYMQSKGLSERVVGVETEEQID